MVYEIIPLLDTFAECRDVRVEVVNLEGLSLGVYDGCFQGQGVKILTLLGGGNSNIFYFYPEPWGNDPI